MTRTCLMVTSVDTSSMPSEGQEVINLLNRSEIDVQLLQTRVDSMELYRMLRNGPFDLVWVASHAAPDGFHFGDFVLAPSELGQFLVEAKSHDLVLNSCMSMSHITAIQAIAHVNIIATTEEIDDRLAWRSGLYLAQALVRTKSLKEAYRSTLTSGDSKYRWFPTIVERTDTPMAIDSHETNRLEKTVEELERALSGDHFLGSKGLIAAVHENRSLIDSHKTESDKRFNELESRVRVLEARDPGSVLVLTRTTVRLLITAFIVASVLLIFLTYLASYH